jgi:hypothetical protein
MASAVTHARSFLDTVDPDASAVELVDAALRPKVPDRATWRTVRRIEEWSLDQCKSLGVEPAEALKREEVLDVIAAVRLVTTTRPASLRGLSIPGFRHRAAALLDSLEPDFVPVLLKETRRRMAADPAFAAAIADARGGIAPLRRRAERLLREVRGAVGDEFADDPDLPVALQRADDDQAGEVAVGIFVVILLVVVTVWWIATNDPAKN